MGNIVKFPGKRPAPAEAVKAAETAAKLAAPKAVTVRAVAAWLLLLIRWPLFLVLYWLRTPVTLLCSVLSFPFLLAWLFALYAFPDKTAMVWGFAIVSFVSFVLGYAYDLVLLALAPGNTMMTL